MASITFAILIISLVAIVGLVVGEIKVRGIGLGPAGILFSGILFGHFGASIDPEITKFVKEFGLILFVFTMGMQVGPGILQMWRSQGLVLNAMAAAIVVQGFTLVIGFHALLDLPALATAGIFSGATTNTPSLGAAEQAASMLETSTDMGLESLTAAYAVAYPGGVIGIIASMLLIRRLCRIDVVEETKNLREIEQANREPVQRSCITIDNRHLSGIQFGKIPGVEETGVRISRIKRANEDDANVATDQTELHDGDVIQVVGSQRNLERFTPLIGRLSDIDLMQASGHVEFRRIFVTEPNMLNKTLHELALDHLYNVTVTRIIRSSVEMPASGSSRFCYGDVAHVVGDRVGLERITKVLGNSKKSLEDTPFLPLFAGIVAGVLLGMIPFHFPGVPFPVKLGLAGGPLLAAIIFSTIGNVGKVVWYIPFSANRALRELGIILFLACAGLGTGPTFFDAAMSIDGFKWMLVGFAVTMIPLMITGMIARVRLKQNYLAICGVLAGSMTDPPALVFANSLSESDGCSSAYAAVYPLTMILRIIAAQGIVFMLA